MGVEEEFLLVDADGELAGLGVEVVGAAHDPQGVLETELTCSQVEAVTGVCDTPEGVLGQLTDLRGELAGAARRHGLRLVPSGVPVLPERRLSITPKPRYLLIAEHFGAATRAGATCGCHVHIGMPDRALGVWVINRVRAWLPTLLAVTANSPFDGMDTGYASWRYQNWSRWPSAGPPPRFASLDEYDSIVDGLLRSGAILDRGMVYWDVRLSEHQPTVEFRVSDVAATAGDAALFAALVRGLVAHVLDGGSVCSDVSPAVLRANLWRASRDGLGGCCLHPVTGEAVPVHEQLGDLLAMISGVLGDDAEFVRAGLAKLREQGGGADRQRRIYSRRRLLSDVVDDLALR
ncbi:carboxylate--amine ligase [Actinophytocola xinjiangensis]|uniref:Putative glutamate--cysteine ligase 2 n=1 Tax=Actinophytocola xinjiangensis TaxID=485602 RepID=A0A7Z0WRM0_9PSEU|nr:glutamate--cysteine ligase [Actinophytocola xinjiangensis]OLF13196.1 carboxylate--amine ligase [Actinophytocola xinjiangensis]